MNPDSPAVPSDEDGQDLKDPPYNSVYSNNIRFESTVWDLKIVFGQLFYQSEQQIDVDWHTAVTVPWPQAKILSYFLRLNIAFYENTSGSITIPPSVTPSPPEPPRESLASDSNVMAQFELLKRIYDETFGDAKAKDQR